MQDPKNSKLMKKKSKLQLEIFEKSLKTNALDITQNSPRQRKISITVEDVKSRQRKGRQGYLNKKGKDKEWKRRYFATKKPYLYYYNRKEDLINGIRENGAIDLTKSVITLNKPDPKNPFTFGIITKQKIWVLRANNEKEMFAWIEELDPNQSRKASLSSPIKTMDVEVKKISGSMPKLDLSNLSYSIDNNSIDGINESKDMNLSDIENISNINLSDTSHDISSNDIHEISNNTNNDLNNSKSELNILNNYLDENLNVGIDKPRDKEDDSSEAPLLDKKDYGHDQKLLELVNKVNQLHSKLKLAKSNLRDKDQHVESLQKQLLSARKSFEEIPKQYEEQLGLMTENLRIIKEDTKKDNSLIVELFQKDSKTPVPKYNKQGYLDLVKQLENSREVSRAHISHNRYLSQEIDRIQHEHKITINRYKQILESCGIEIDLLTKENQRLQIAQKYYTAKFDLDAPEVEEMDQQIINAQQYQMMKEDFDWLKKSYFVSYALGVKMSIQMALNKNVNFNVHELFDEAMEKGIPVKDWSQWITRRLMDS